jgi:hypothetical protein
VPEGSIELALIRPEQDRARAGKSDCGTPRRGSAGGERVEIAAAGDDDQAQRAWCPMTEPGPLCSAASPLGEQHRQIPLSRPCYRGHLSYAHGCWPTLECREENY